MQLLALEDRRWKDLNHRGWVRGRPYHATPDAPFVSDELAELIKDPTDLERFRQLWPWLCTEGTTWAAAYAIVPYAVMLAPRVRAEDRFDYVYFVGAAATYSCPDGGESFEIKPYLRQPYRQALERPRPLLAECLAVRHDVTETRYLLAAMAALQGHTKLARALDHLDCIGEKCPNCETFVYPTELQEAIR